MTSSELRRIVWIPLLVAAACGGSSSSKGPADVVVGVVPAGPNVLAVSVSGAGCRPGAYLNEPCVSATVCVPGTSSCQTVDGLLLDTGSTGLRVFKQALPLSLPAIASGGGSLAECVAYLDGSAQWGPVLRADVVLGGEPAVNVPVQIVDSTYAGAPSPCANAQTDPASAGFNGILGVAPFTQDCGADCAGNAGNGWYFSCAGGTCSGATADAGSQLTNPVAALPGDNNGLSVRLPAVPIAGAGSATGGIVLGIGTRTNNVPPAAALGYPVDLAGLLSTSLAGASYPSFLDTGSNAYFFPTAPDPRLASCPSPNQVWFCPAAPVSLTATNTGATGAPSGPVPFTITSLDQLARSVNVSATIGGKSPGSGTAAVDWGLPFFLGRDVYVVIEGRHSPLGAGPLVGY